MLATYVEEHSTTSTTDAIADLLENDNSLKNALGSMTNSDVKAAMKLKTKSAELLKTFIDLVKKDGTVFSGHIHQHKELVAKGRKFIFVGSPYQQNLGDIGLDCGYYVLDESNKYVFVKSTGLPVHVEVLMSKAAEDIDNYDFSCIRGNIV